MIYIQEWVWWLILKFDPALDSPRQDRLKRYSSTDFSLFCHSLRFTNEINVTLFPGENASTTTVSTWHSNTSHSPNLQRVGNATLFSQTIQSDASSSYFAEVGWRTRHVGIPPPPPGCRSCASSSSRDEQTNDERTNETTRRSSHPFWWLAHHRLRVSADDLWKADIYYNIRSARCSFLAWTRLLILTTLVMSIWKNFTINAFWSGTKHKFMQASRICCIDTRQW